LAVASQAEELIDPDKPYGQRELCILAPDGNLLVFGHSIEERAAAKQDRS
jgi:hypothetical protein